MPGKGPAPLNNAEQQRKKPNPTAGFKQLPAEGRTGDAPAFPIGPFKSDEERGLWNKLWTLPQATMWEHMRCEDTVALYVRVFCAMAAADDSAMVKLGNEVRQLDSKLGLSPRAMLDLRWEIEHAVPDVEVKSNGQIGRVYVPE